MIELFNNLNCYLLIVVHTSKELERKMYMVNTLGIFLKLYLIYSTKNYQSTFAMQAQMNQ